MALIPHPVAGKHKSQMLCNAFIAGAPKNAHGHVFFGVNHTNVGMWRYVQRAQEPFYYIDNSYFDQTRGTHFRISKNSIQYKGPLGSDGKRAAAIELPAIKPWRLSDAGVILVCEQSDVYMHFTINWLGDWLSQELEVIRRQWPEREVIVRRWGADKHSQGWSFRRDLSRASLLITHSSSAAVMAVIEGVQCIVDQVSALAGMICGRDDQAHLDQRQSMINTLADNQWTIEEMQQGKAWSWLNP